MPLAVTVEGVRGRAKEVRNLFGAPAATVAIRWAEATTVARQSRKR